MPYKKPDEVKILMNVFCRRWKAGLYITEQSALISAVFVYAVGYKLIHIMQR
jgi:hypothetical protein